MPDGSVSLRDGRVSVPDGGVPLRDGSVSVRRGRVSAPARVSRGRLGVSACRPGMSLRASASVSRPPFVSLQAVLLSAGGPIFFCEIERALSCQRPEGRRGLI